MVPLFCLGVCISNALLVQRTSKRGMKSMAVFFSFVRGSSSRTSLDTPSNKQRVTCPDKIQTVYSQTVPVLYAKGVWYCSSSRLIHRDQQQTSRRIWVVPVGRIWCRLARLTIFPVARPTRRIAPNRFSILVVH